MALGRPALHRPPTAPVRSLRIPRVLGPSPGGFCYMKGVPRHLVSIADLDAAEIVRILDHGDRYTALASEPIKKLTSLRGRTVINLFFEASTRTRTSFEIAAKRLSAEAVNI